jgi:hypothetical protein
MIALISALFLGLFGSFFYTVSSYSRQLPDINTQFQSQGREECLDIVDRNGKPLYQLNKDGVCETVNSDK